MDFILIPTNFSCQKCEYCFLTFFQRSDRDRPQVRVFLFEEVASWFWENFLQDDQKYVILVLIVLVNAILDMFIFTLILLIENFEEILLFFMRRLRLLLLIFIYFFFIFIVLFVLLRLLFYFLEVFFLFLWFLSFF